MKIIGLTGGICSGKSTVSQILKEKYDAKLIDADKLGHEAYLPGTLCLDNIINHFGEHLRNSDGTINRRELGAIVFDNKDKMKELQAIVWPEIRMKIIEKLNEYRSQNVFFVVLEAAVMIEANWQDLVDTLWVICVDPAVATCRLMERNNFTKDQAESRIRSQISNEERCQHAHVVLMNNGDSTTDAVKSSLSALEDDISRTMEVLLNT